MIHHISIPAKNPPHVAQILAELFKKGYAAPFPSHSDSYVAFAADGHGTLVEVYPLGTEMIPGENEQPIQYRKSDLENQFIATRPSGLAVECLELLDQSQRTRRQLSPPAKRLGIGSLTVSIARALSRVHVGGFV